MTILYTVIIDPDSSCPDFEDYLTEEEALDRIDELRARGVDVDLGITD